MKSFDEEVSKIGKRKSAEFFAKRLLVFLVVTYFLIALYGRIFGGAA